MVSKIEVDTVVNQSGDQDSGLDLSTNDVVAVKTANTERMRVDAGGDVGIGVSPETDHYGAYVNVNFGVSGLVGSNSSGTNTTFLTNNAYLNTGPNWIYKETDEATKYNQSAGKHVWEGASSGSAGGTISFTEHMTLDASGRLLIGATSYDASNKGVYLNGASGKGFFTVSGDAPLAIHRLSDDGDLIELRQANNTEGTISVSGSTVSYNGFSGLHESSGIATNTPIGTVVSTIDELDVYSAKQNGMDGEEVDSPKAGETRADHAKVKISDTAGDKAVYGVVGSFNAQGKVNVASVGIGSVRVTGACAKGDLLESNGDGTAKVQSDDIVRSKTIGKVTIGNSSTDVKLVSCVLYCG